MAQGKFSQPRPHRDEERQIEDTFRQLTGRGGSAPGQPIQPMDPLPQEYKEALAEEPFAQIPEADISGSPVFETTIPPNMTPQPLQPELQIPAAPISLPQEDGFHPVTLPHSLAPGAASEDPAVSGKYQTRTPASPVQSVPLGKRAQIKQYLEYPTEEEMSQLDDGSTPEPDFLDKALSFWQNHQRAVILGLCGCLLLVIFLVAGIFLINTTDQRGGEILPNVYLADIPVGGMTKSEAISAVQAATAQTFEKRDMVVQLGTGTLTLSPQDTKIKLDVKSAVEAAYSYGRTGTKAEQERIRNTASKEDHIIALLPHLDLDISYIHNTLTAYAQSVGSTLVQTTYGLEGIMPELGTEKFDEKAPTQTLVITVGTPGVGFDSNAACNVILDAYSLHQFSAVVNTVNTTSAPDPLDLDEVYKEYYIAPVNSSIATGTYETVPGSYGYGFDLPEAKKLLAKAEYGQVLRIPMVYITPEVLNQDLYFKDVLGECTTSFSSSNTNRVHNLQLVCDTLNGKIMNPGEMFSFNDFIGQRTSEKGYRMAPAYSGTDLVDTIGGGVCQTSTTLYNAALLADLEIVTRTGHGFPASYVPYGLDATVSWPSPDLKFRNTTAFPIKLEAYISGSQLTMRILGTDKRTYFIKMVYEIVAVDEPTTEYREFPENNPEGYKDGDVIEEGVTGYNVKTYRVKYDKQTGNKLSSSFEANTRYLTKNRVIASVKPAETTVPTTEATVPTTEPATEPTTAPTETVPETSAAPSEEPPAPPSEAPADVGDKPGQASDEEGRPVADEPQNEGYEQP